MILIQGKGCLGLFGEDDYHPSKETCRATFLCTFHNRKIKVKCGKWDILATGLIMPMFCIAQLLVFLIDNGKKHFVFISNCQVLKSFATYMGSTSNCYCHLQMVNVTQNTLLSFPDATWFLWPQWNIMNMSRKGVYCALNDSLAICEGPTYNNSIFSIMWNSCKPRMELLPISIFSTLKEGLWLRFAELASSIDISYHCFFLFDSNHNPKSLSHTTMALIHHSCRPSSMLIDLILVDWPIWIWSSKKLLSCLYYHLHKEGNEIL